MKITKTIICAFLLCFSTIIHAQHEPKASTIDGKYTALVEEKGMSGPTKDKVIQLAENNGVQMLAVAACEKCFPAIYTYNADITSKLKKTVFSNSIGLYVINYNDKGFVVVMPDLTFKTNFSYLNYYGKNKSEVTQMTTDKIDSFAAELLDHL